MDRCRLSIVACATALPLLALPARANHDSAPHPAETAPDAVHCRDNDAGSHDFVTPVDGEPAFGMFTAPDTDPTVLVVIGHGSTHTVESWRPHAEGLTASYGTLTVAMEYRGMERVPGEHHNDDPTLPEAKNWPQKAGGEDLIAAAKRFQAECPTIETTILVGVSMGAAMSGYAVSHLPAGDEGLFDYWVAVEGVHDTLETYHEAVAVGHPAAGWIEAETGGTPAEVPQEYEERSNVLKTGAIESAGLSRVVYLHAVYDGVVGYHQSRQMAAELQVPFEFYTVTTRGRGSDGRTVTDLFIDAGEGILAGHAGEWNAEALLMRATFERIGAIASGQQTLCGEYLVEEGAMYPDVVFPPLLTYPCALPGDPGSGGGGSGTPGTPGKVTGGGKIEPDENGELVVLELATMAQSNGATANFGFVVQLDEGDAAPKGNLSYRDRDTDLKIKGKSFHALEIADGACGPDTHATFVGTADVDGTTETVQVEADDCGEPGRADTFHITTDTYEGSGVLTGGNIQIHRAAGEPPGESCEPLDVQVFAPVPAPGQPEGIAVAEDGTVYVGTNVVASMSRPEPSKIFAYAPDGQLLQEYTVPGVEGLLGMAFDGNGLLYVVDPTPPRVIRLDPQTGAQSDYTVFRDVLPCSQGGAPGDCSETQGNDAPLPNYPVFAADGTMYVTDSRQALIWRVPPGGGSPDVWFSHPSLEAIFGPNGIQFKADGTTLLFALTGSQQPGTSLTLGALYELPVLPDGSPGTLTQFWQSQPVDGPDGFSIAASGNVYVALAGTNQLVLIAPNGDELARVLPTEADPPMDMPASTAFLGERLLVTNQSLFVGNPNSWVVYDVCAGEPGLPLHRPPIGP